MSREIVVHIALNIKDDGSLQVLPANNSHLGFTEHLTLDGGGNWEYKNNNDVHQAGSIEASHDFLNAITREIL